MRRLLLGLLLVALIYHPVQTQGAINKMKISSEITKNSYKADNNKYGRKRALKKRIKCKRTKRIHIVYGKKYFSKKSLSPYTNSPRRLEINGKKN